MTRVLTKEADKYESMIEDLLFKFIDLMDFEYDMKRYKDNYISISLSRTDLTDDDGDEISLEMCGNFDGVYYALEGWLINEENR